MSILKVARMGHPVLRQQARTILPKELKTVLLQKFIDDMIETMQEYSGVGLAAPQVGVPRRLFTYGWTDEAGTKWRGVAINPELWISPPPAGEPDEDEESEGCLSFPGERFGLRRAERAILRATDLDGQRFEITAEGWLARIFQHEYDHLDGTLYVDRLGERDQRPPVPLALGGWGNGHIVQQQGAVLHIFQHKHAGDSATVLEHPRLPGCNTPVVVVQHGFRRLAQPLDVVGVGVVHEEVGLVVRGHLDHPHAARGGVAHDTA